MQAQTRVSQSQLDRVQKELGKTVEALKSTMDSDEKKDTSPQDEETHRGSGCSHGGVLNPDFTFARLQGPPGPPQHYPDLISF